MVRPTLRLSLAALLALALPLSAARADVLVVDGLGTGDFDSLIAAVAAAEEGDVLLVKHLANTWPIVTVTLGDKSLTIVSDGGQPDVDRLVVQDLPAGKVIVLRGLDLDAGLQLIDNQGSVRVESCLLQGLGGSPGGPTSESFDGSPGLRIEGCHDVALADCSITGGNGADVFEDDTEWNPTAGGAGLALIDSRVTLTHCGLVGGQGGSDFDDGDSGRNGGDGVSNVDGTLVLVGGSLVGGDGGNGGCNFFPSFCGWGGSGGNGLRNATAGAASFVRGIALMQGGAAGSGAGGMPDGSAGRKILQVAGSVTSWGHSATGFSVSSPVREGQPLAVSATGQPGDAIWVLASLAPAQSVKPPYQGSLLVGAPLFVQLPLGVVPGSGTLQVVTPAPVLVPGAESLDVFLQGVVQRGSTWLLAPASTLTLLDAAF
jgi:hypothetical protein